MDNADQNPDVSPHGNGGSRPSGDIRTDPVARRRFGHVAGILFVVGGLSSVPSSLLLEPAPSALIAPVTAFALVAGLVCFALPWERARPGAMHLAIAIGTITVGLAIAAASPSYGVYCILIAVFASYTFRSRSAIGAHLALLAAVLLAPLAYSPSMARETLQASALLVPNMIAAAVLIAALREQREGLERSYRHLASEALSLANRISARGTSHNF